MIECGAASSVPGANTKVKFIDMVDQSMRRRLATVAVIGRPSTFRVTVSPIARPRSRAIRSSNDTSGGPA